MHDDPLPLPAAVRTPPPRVPPAPPATGEQGFGYTGPPMGEFWLQRRLEECLSPLAAILTTFETLEVFPDDADLYQEMFVIIQQAREDALHQLKGGSAILEQRELALIRSELRLRVTPDDPELEAVKKCLLPLLESGIPASRLGWVVPSHMLDDLSDAGSNAADLHDFHVRYELLPPRTLPEVRILPPVLFTRAILDDLCDSLRESDHYTSKRQFSRQVGAKMFMVMWGVMAAVS